jgi:predicted peptidase
VSYYEDCIRDRLNLLLKNNTSKYRINKKRIYLTDISMGAGYGRPFSMEKFLRTLPQRSKEIPEV